MESRVTSRSQEQHHHTWKRYVASDWAVIQYGFFRPHIGYYQFSSTFQTNTQIGFNVLLSTEYIPIWFEPTYIVVGLRYCYYYVEVGGSAAAQFRYHSQF